MATTTRQTAIFGVQDWKQIYQTYQEANFQSYDFETLRKTFVDYLRLYYPETFNDYIESSEFIALLDVMAFMGQSLAFRTDLNNRENYLGTAERRDSVIKLSNLVSYVPLRNTEASGYLKVFSISTTENLVDYNGVNLSNITVNWADPTNLDWQEQFTTILNASLLNTQRFGRPAASQTILGVNTQEYTINLVPGYLPVVPYTAVVDGISMPFEAINATSAGQDYVYEPPPLPDGRFNILFRNDQLGFASANTGFFFFFKQGTLQNQDFNLVERITNRAVDINIDGINNTDVWLYQLDNLGNVQNFWFPVQSVYAAAAQQTSAGTQQIYSIASRNNDQITLNFGDGIFSTIPVGTFRTYVRASNGLTYIINPQEMQNIQIPISYVSRTGQIETLTFNCGITQPVTNAQARETINDIKQRAPAQYYTQNRMVNGEDYTNFPYTQYNSILKSAAVNRASIGTSRYLDLVDGTGKYSSTNIFASDGAMYETNLTPAFLFSWLSINDISSVVKFADTIAYIGRDIQDAKEIGLIDDSVPLPEECTAVLGNSNREIINTLIYDLLENSESENEGYIAYSRKVEKALIGLREFSRTNIYNNEKLTKERSKIERMYATLFETYLQDLESERKDTRIVTDYIETGWINPRYLETATDAELVRDFIAGMTDRYFAKRFEEYVIPKRVDAKFS